MQLTSPAIFTICSNNYLPMARVLLASARQHHPEATFYLCLADLKIDGLEMYPDNAEVIEACALGIPDFPSFAFRYDIMEFNTALKPFMIRHLLIKGHQSVVYFDPDIEVFSRLDSVFALLDGGASFVLTPHLLQPSERDSYPDDVGIMLAGIYNLGFLAVGAGAEADGVLRWWSRRLLYQCINDQPNGLFVDQRFMDLVPGFADHSRVLRQAPCNVAYWNLHQRTLVHALVGDDTATDHWTIDGQPLCFFHFSGITATDTSKLSKHTTAFRDEAIEPALQSLIERYVAKLWLNGQGQVPDAIYAYGRFASGVRIPSRIRHMFRERHLHWCGDPFESFEEYLHLPDARCFGQDDFISHLMRDLYEAEPWLQASFPATSAGSAKSYSDWYIRHAHSILKDRRLVAPVALRRARGAVGAATTRPPQRLLADEPDVVVVGYLQLTLGVGEAGRQVLKALRHGGLNARGLPIDLHSLSSADNQSIDHLLVERADARVLIFNVNADQLPQVIAHCGDRLRKNAYRIVVPFWELEEFPQPWLAAFDHVDEVWAPTRFIQAALAHRIAKPVHHVPLSLDFEVPVAPSRRKFGLPENAFVFFFSFDYLSFVERKNPMAAVRAYRKAFSASERTQVRLVIKTLNADRAPQAGQDMRELLRADPDIVLLEPSLNRADTLELIAACDAVVSLHRSEGLGLLIAEAMVLGKPVVATDYSATTELVSQQTGWPVDFEMVPVPAGAYVHPQGQVWASPDEGHAAWQMRQVVYRPEEARRRAAAARAFVQDRHGKDVCGRRLAARVSALDART